jgi:prophage regulatory protein
MLIKMKEVTEIVGFTPATIYSYISEGLFPQQIKFGKRSVCWKKDDVVRWVNNGGVSGYRGAK